MLVIKATDIKSTELKDIIEELEAEHLETCEAIAQTYNKATFDIIEAIATHIYYNDTDYICD